MRLPASSLFASSFALLAACTAGSTDPTPDAGTVPDAGVVDAGPVPVVCGGVTCRLGELCLERASRPGTPACVAPGDCDVKPAGADPFGAALQAVGLTRCTATIPDDYLGPRTPDTVKVDAAHRLPHFDHLHSNPLEVPAWGDTLARSFAPGGSRRVSQAIAAAAGALGARLDTRPVTLPAPAADPLVAAVQSLAEDAGATVNVGSLTSDAEDVPADVQLAAARLVDALHDAWGVRRDVFANVANLATLQRCASGMILPTTNCSQFSLGSASIKALFDGAVDLPALYQAAHDLAAAVESAPLAAIAGREGFSFDQPTPLGRIVISDAGAQVFEAVDGHIALLLDLGGDDVYRVPAGATGGAKQGVALHVDLGGNDTYGYKAVAARGDEGRLPSDGEGRYREGNIAEGQTAMSLSTIERQGAGLTGIGLLFDLAGDDTYTSLRASQGYASFGVGVLADRAGDDRYAAEAGAQGSAMFGIGLLLDDAGNDERRIYAFGQGFGYTNGLGAIVDGAGDDVYFANPGDPTNGGDPLFATPQMPGRANSSFVQGAGFGRRDDSAVAPMSGGIGLSADFGTGKDSYQAGVFAQATGYFFGSGVLFDEGGDDLYDGFWYVRGADAHFAIASFHDLAGNDHHNTRFAGAATSLGVGHDHSIGWLIDDSGNDTYLAPGLALGSGNACGWGFLVDGGGDDRYESKGLSLGRFGDPKGCSYALQSTLGIMVDAGGHDTYVVADETLTREGTVTTADAQADAPQASGAHADGEGVLLVLP